MTQTWIKNSLSCLLSSHVELAFLFCCCSLFSMLLYLHVVALHTCWAFFLLLLCDHELRERERNLQLIGSPRSRVRRFRPALSVWPKDLVRGSNHRDRRFWYVKFDQCKCRITRKHLSPPHRHTQTRKHLSSCTTNSSPLPYSILATPTPRKIHSLTRKVKELSKKRQEGTDCGPLFLTTISKKSPLDGFKGDRILW